MARFGTQVDLARVLQITDRRVRQLEAEHIIPAVRQDGRYDLELAVERFALYRNGTPEDWRQFEAELEREAGAVSLLVNDGPQAARSRNEVQEASERLQALFAALRFSLMCHHRQDDFARQCMLEAFGRMENEGLGVLLGRAVEVLAAEAGVSVEQGIAQLAAEGRR